MDEKSVSEVMRKDVVSISKDSSILDLARLLFEKKVSGVPVIAEDGTLLGMVSEADIIDWSRKKNIYLPLLNFPIYDFGYMANFENMNMFEENKEQLENTKVGEIMTTNVKKVRQDEFASVVADIMVNGRLNRVPVVDEKNRVKGIVTRADLLRSIVSSVKRSD